MLGVCKRVAERQGLIYLPSGLGPAASLTYPVCRTHAASSVLCLVPLTECCSHRTYGDLVNGLYQQILLSLQKVLDPVGLCSHYGAVVGLHALGWKVGTLAFSQSHKSFPFIVRKIIFLVHERVLFLHFLGLLSFRILL